MVQVWACQFCTSSVKDSSLIPFKRLTIFFEKLGSCHETVSGIGAQSSCARRIVFSPSKSSQEITPDNWKSRSPNERRKWDEYVFIAMIKTLGGGNVDAGRQQIESLVETGTISKSALATVDRFLDDALQFKNDRNLAFNTRDFAIFQLFWFGLYEKNKCFKITNTKLFKSAFMAAYSLYTGKNTELNNFLVLKLSHITFYLDPKALLFLLKPQFSQ